MWYLLGVLELPKTYLDIQLECQSTWHLLYTVELPRTILGHMIRVLEFLVLILEYLTERSGPAQKHAYLSIS